MPPRSKWQSLPTEAINPSTLGIDKLTAGEIVDLMMNEDRKMLAAVQRERERIAVGVEMIASALRKGGRIVFVGAGTSGRLGILESTEMPPTFSTDPSLVQAIMAGGHQATFVAKEGVEDHYEEGSRSVTRLKIQRSRDACTVSAYGRIVFFVTSDGHEKPPIGGMPRFHAVAPHANTPAPLTAASAPRPRHGSNLLPRTSSDCGYRKRHIGNLRKLGGCAWPVRLVCLSQEQKTPT